MKICICSDSHGNRDGLRRIAELERPDVLLFAGDGLSDLKDLNVPQIHSVCGNGDLTVTYVRSLVLELGGVKILLCHGHWLQVKRTLDVLLNEALACGAAVAVFGHTHMQHLEYQAGVLLLNGGCAGQGKYAVMNIDKGEVLPELKALPVI